MSDKATFLNRIQDIHRIGSIQGHLGWDQETLMPEKGAKSRFLAAADNSTHNS